MKPSHEPAPLSDSTFVGLRVKHPRERVSVPSSRKRRADCGHRIWVSPASRARADECGRAICHPCWTALVEEGLPIGLHEMSPEQMEEMSPKVREIVTKLGLAP